MKQNLLPTLCLAIALCLSTVTYTSCSVASVEGNGDLKRENRTLTDFTEIDMSLSGQAEIRQGAAFSVAVEAESNLLDLIETKVKGNTLVLKTKGNFTSTKGIRVYITLPALDGAEVSGSGSMKVLDIFSPAKLDVDVSGSGIFYGNFIAGQVLVDVSGSGSVQLLGSADELKADITGSGSVDMDEMAAKEVHVDVTGSGEAACHALEVLEVNVTGSGEVKYKGNPHKIIQDVTGSGKVVKM